MVANALTTVSTYLLQVGLAAGVSVAWIVMEYLARSSTWRQGAPRRPPSTLDRGTYPVIAIGLAVGMATTFFAFFLAPIGHLPIAVTAFGLVVVALGLTIRFWALSTLGKFFTMPITIRPDHELVRGGPYRWLRHPAYTGGFLTALGVPLVLGTSLGVLVTLAACIIVYVYRIRIEEAALVSRFGEAYLAYARSTWRLVPGVY
ncbi:MAG: methyltransferase family protein [Thermoplasmata archaeon]